MHTKQTLKIYFLVLSILVITPKKHVSSISAVDGSTKNTLRFRKKMKKFTTPLFYDPIVDEIPISNFFGFDAFLNICSIPHFSTFVAFLQRIFTFWHPNLSYLTLFLYLGV